jgi:ribosomal-protein-alanine N-acetyltransferase
VINPDKVTIPLFAVDPRYRNAGTGSKLMEEFKTRLIMEGKRYIQLEVKEVNTAAISFYKKRGFFTIEYLDNFYNDGSNAVKMICNVYTRS